MGIAETLILYLLIGSAVGAALWVVQRETAAIRDMPKLAAWIVLWPFFAPSVLGQAVANAEAGRRAAPGGENPRLHEAQTRLLAAIRSVDSVADGVLRPHIAQIDTMMRSLDHAQERLNEMEELLATPEFEVAQVEGALRALRERGYEEEEPRVRSLLSRRRNIERLRAMRDHTRDELERALLRLDEIRSQVLLLRFADQPEIRLAALLKDVARNVDDLAKAALEMNDLC